ncbi:hypothetical protein KZ866_33690, partial [Pseudomonas aeruginosa]
KSHNQDFSLSIFASNKKTISSIGNAAVYNRSVMINSNVRSEMALQILQKQLDESSHCPLCQASMYWVDAEQFEQDVQFHECSHCQHPEFKNKK